MNGETFDALGVKIEGIKALYCRTMPDTNIIKSKTLGGSWFVQTVGSAAVKASVLLSIKGIDARDELLTMWSIGDQFRIELDGYRRTGFILTQPKIETARKGIPALRKFSAVFDFAVLAEEAIE